MKRVLLSIVFESRKFIIFIIHQITKIDMRFFSILVPMLIVIYGCSDDPEVEVERTDFAEVTVDGKKFSFNRLEAKVIKGDVSQGDLWVACELNFADTTTNSYLSFYTEATYQIVNKYIAGDLFPTPTVHWLNLQTYFNRMPGTYTMRAFYMTVTIDKDKDSRMHGVLSGKVECLTCPPDSELVSISGEFEVPYTYR